MPTSRSARPAATVASASTVLAVAALAVVVALTPVAALALDPDGGWRRFWPNTDFDSATVPLSEVRAGGPVRDAIPALDAPAMIPVADKTLPGREPVLTLELPGAAPHAWPLRYLMWHEIVNDVIEGRRVAVTFCPLCNAGVVFEARGPDGAPLTFGVTGLLRHADMIMFDRETESWWQQFTGEAIFGALAGARLERLPSRLESWDAFRERAPEGLVMDRPTEHERDYGANPYLGYDDMPGPELYRGELPPGDIAALSRVVVVGARAWPVGRIVEAGELVEAGLRFVHADTQASALDSHRIADGRAVAGVWVTDAVTGAPVAAEVVFAFAFTAFEPEGEWMLGD